MNCLLDHFQWVWTVIQLTWGEVGMLSQASKSGFHEGGGPTWSQTYYMYYTPTREPFMQGLETPKSSRGSQAFAGLGYCTCSQPFQIPIMIADILIVLWLNRLLFQGFQA